MDPEQTIGVIGEDFEEKRNSLTVTSEQLKNSRQNPTTSFSNSATAIGGGITTAAGTKPLSVTSISYLRKMYIQSKSFLNVAIKALGVPPQEDLQLWPVDFSGVFLGPVLVMTLPLSPPARVNF